MLIKALIFDKLIMYIIYCIICILYYNINNPKFVFIFPPVVGRNSLVAHLTVTIYKLNPRRNVNQGKNILLIPKNVSKKAWTNRKPFLTRFEKKVFSEPLFLDLHNFQKPTIIKKSQRNDLKWLVFNTQAVGKEYVTSVKIRSLTFILIFS